MTMTITDYAISAVETIIAPVRGFTVAGVPAGIRKSGRRDMALIASMTPCAAAGVFTTNQVKAAPVLLDQARLAANPAGMRAVVVNSGVANACTGAQGLAAAAASAELVAAALGCRAEDVFVLSTGVIGVPLPMDKIAAGVSTLAASLAPDGWAAAADAILTTDTVPKTASVRVQTPQGDYTIAAIAKGAGMIAPNMATMLAVIATDAALAPSALQAALSAANRVSFNQIVVDGDMSTNDTVLVLANGRAGNRPLGVSAPGFPQFQAALSHACLALARMIVRDGEGVSRCVTVRVQGARSFADADAAARAVANSPLVKTSWHGGDPNWGRILAAIGYSAATIEESKVDIGYSAPGSRRILWSLRRGQPTAATFKALCAAVAPREFDLHVNLNIGRARAVIYAADLTEAYVDFNKGDVSDPSSLGG